MHYLKGFIGSLIFFIGSACLLVFLFISVDIDPSRGIIIFIIFFSIGMARLGYGIFTGKIKFLNLKNPSIKKNKLLLKRSKKIISTDKDSVKFLRLFIVVFLISTAVWALFIPDTRDSIFSRAVSENVSNIIYTKSKVKKCEYKEWIVKNPFYNWTREEWEKGKNDPNPLVSDMYNKVKLFYPELKRRCYTINLKKFIIENNISNQQANNFIKNKTYLLSSLERSVTRKEIGNFFLEKRYYKNYNKSAKLIKIIHPIIFIILILVIWQFRHSMTNLILKIIYKIKSEI
tara:strand:+ start:118 stop:981 length:864 start_codon:yes stop_codon:yes gene_type:complete